ncbi:Zinc finger, ZZ-type [Phytophthora cactorum]|nr:Zinc finger, ZZ-type [Phytophthora cactorum]
MLATATLQHNLAALQAQLATLQQENSALTRDLCLKENYIQLKDQQFRVMQRRLEELEGAVAQWKDRWLQQVNAQQATSSSGDDNNDAVGGQTDRLEDAKWTPWKCKPGTANRAKALAQASAKLEKLSQVDRNKLQPLLVAIDQGGIGAVKDLVFADVSEELSRILLLYLLPALLDAMDGTQQLQCFSRTYRKQTMDFRVCTRQAAEATAVSGAAGPEELAASTASATSTADKPPTPSVLGACAAETSGETLVPIAQLTQEAEETEAPHLLRWGGHPLPPREREGKDGKIKKIVGSVFDRLSRHKSQQSLVSSSSSSSHASPVALTGSTEATGDEDESICDGCGRGPLVGVKWVCRTCRLLAGEEYELCEKCYGQGIHGKEHEDALFARVEAIVRAEMSSARE